jgi:hypothetical protein
MPKPRRAALDLEVKVQTDESQQPISCRCDILSMSGIFVRKIQLSRGTQVVVNICKGRCAATLTGVISANYKDLGVAIQFTEKTDSRVRELAALLDT